MSTFLDEQALLHASPTGVLYDVNGDNQAVGILINGDGRTLKTFETQTGVTPDSVPYATVTMPCGKATIYETKETFPKQSQPCSCGKDGHWFVYWVTDEPEPVEEEEPEPVAKPKAKAVTKPEAEPVDTTDEPAPIGFHMPEVHFSISNESDEKK